MIRILVCGGTFDKQYDEITGRVFFKDTHVSEMLRLGRCRVDVPVQTLMRVNSLEMNEADRGRIAAQCLECPESRIVITAPTRWSKRRQLSPAPSSARSASLPAQ